MSEIENSGSQARDHLANERTFLAWVRTSLAFVGLGVVIAKVGERTFETTLLSITLLVGGLVASTYSLLRYRRVTNALVAGRYRVARNGPIAMVAIAVVLSAFMGWWALTS